jgi:hypothetical protein
MFFAKLERTTAQEFLGEAVVALLNPATVVVCVLIYLFFFMK